MKYFLKIFILFSFYLSHAYAFSDANLPNTQYNSAVNDKSNLSINTKPKVFEGVSIQENLGKNIDLNLVFFNEHGEKKTFQQILQDDNNSAAKPVLLSLNYYRCKTLCSIQLMNLAKVMSELGWQIGKDFTMATVSFDPSDTAKSATEAKNHYLSLIEQKNPQWHFYTADKTNIEKLTKQLGFFYSYDPDSKEFAHAAAIFFISARGKISRYLYGIDYAPKQIKFSLIDASENKIGSPTDKILLTCFHYDPVAGRYNLFAINLLRISAAVTLLLVLFALLYFFKRDKKRKV